MLHKVAGFHDKAVRFFQDTSSLLHMVIKRKLPALFLLFWVSFVSMYQLNLYSAVRQSQAYTDTMEAVMAKQEEAILSQIDGRLFESTEGIMHTTRVHGENYSYLFFFAENETSTPYVYNQSTNEWLTEPLEVNPLVTQAFVSTGIGVPTKQSDNTVWVGEEAYEVDWSDGRVEIDGDSIYAPLPSLPGRISKFVEETISSPIDEAELLLLTRDNEKELIYFSHHGTVYQLKAYFDESAELGEVVGSAKNFME